MKEIIGLMLEVADLNLSLQNALLLYSKAVHNDDKQETERVDEIINMLHDSVEKLIEKGKRGCIDYFGYEFAQQQQFQTEEDTLYKVWVPIVDEEGTEVDLYREDWHKNDSPEAAAEQGYLMACEETWGENNEFKPTRKGVRVEFNGGEM